MRKTNYLILLPAVFGGALAVHSAGCALDTYGTLFADSDAGVAPDADSGKGGEGGGGSPFCGDHAKNNMAEICDGDDLAGATCKSLGFAGGILSCQADCGGFITTACTTPPGCGDGTCNGSETCTSCALDCGACCGNGAIDLGEPCDGAKLGGATCSSILGSGYSGAVTCKGDCTGFITSSCVPPVTCGNGTKESGESCDGADLDSKSCTTVPGGFTAGTLSCKVDCTFDVSKCTTCGNGSKEVGETCDGLALGGNSCTTVPGGFTGGVLGCKSDCSAFVTTGCTKCGNGTKESGESCDGIDLDSKSCTTVPGGFTGGVLGCKVDCTFNTTSCTKCGNNIKEGTETCDGTDLNGSHCETIPGGFTGGTLGCQGDCSGFDSAGCLTLTTCTGGTTPGTAGQVTGVGMTSVSMLIWASDGSEQDYTGTTSAVADITGKQLPGLAIIDGKGKTGFDVQATGGGAMPQIWYLIDMATLPAAQCGGGLASSLACRSIVAKSFRCQHLPYMESVGCPAPVTFTVKPAASSFSIGTVEQMLAVALSCP